MSQSDSLSTSLTRWQRALSGRQRWTREAWLDRLVAANKTWSPDELAVFWGQNREPSNYPIIHPVIESVCGLEAQTRRDTAILARVRDHMDTAEALTGLVKYVDQQNKTHRVRSKAFRHAVVEGLGITEVAWSDDPMAETIAKRAVDPMHFWLDPASREDDWSDALDCFRARWLPKAWVDMRWDLARGFAMSDIPSITYDRLSHTEDYNERKGDEPPVGLFNQGWGGDPNFGPGHGIQAPLVGYGWATQDADTWARVNRYENLVLVVERWYRADEWAMFVVMRDGRVIEISKESARDCARLVLDGRGKLVRGIARRVRCAAFVANGGGSLLHDVPSPYPHGQLPFIPTWGYRDEEGQPLGLVRLLRDASREYNMRRTSLTKRSLMRQVHYEEGAFQNVDEAVAEVAKYNGVVALNEGAIARGAYKIVDNGGASPGSAQMEENLLAGALNMVQNLGPVTQEALGQQSDAKSGVAIQERKEGSQTSLFSLFDSRNWAQQAEQEQTLALIQESYTEEKEIRINGTRRGLDYLHINKQDPTTGAVLNDISQGRYDVIVDEQPATATQRAAHLQALSQLLQGADLPPPVRMKVIIALAEGQDMGTSVLETLDEALQMLSQPQQPEQAPPEPPKNITEVVRVGLAELTPNERAQTLTQMGIQPDPEGPAQPDPMQAKLATQEAQQGHQASEAGKDRQHQERMAAMAHQQGMEQSDIGHRQAMEQTDAGHRNSLEQAERQAALAPPPPQTGASL